jgi:hypothetical protein
MSLEQSDQTHELGLEQARKDVPCHGSAGLAFGGRACAHSSSCGGGTGTARPW